MSLFLFRVFTQCDCYYTSDEGYFTYLLLTGFIFSCGYFLPESFSFPCIFLMILHGIFTLLPQNHYF